MNKELLTKAMSGDASALATLRRTTPASLTVFVAPGGKLNVDDTLAAFEYYKLHNMSPDEWHDAPTLTLTQAFVQKVKRNPLTLHAVTPGTWSDLWSADGHKMIAAIHWGMAHGHIRESALKLRGRVSRHLSTPDQFLLDLVIEMERNEAQARAAMDAVLCPLETATRRDVPQRQQTTAQQVGKKTALATLEEEYGAGRVDISRYLRLRANLETEAAQTASAWSHEKYVALHRVVREYFSLSEVQGLIFGMGLNCDDFSNRHDTAARELCQWAKRRSALDKLSNLVKKANPNRWVEFAAEWM